MRASSKLRELLGREKALLAVGVFNPMVAKLGEQAGFEALYLPGGGIALNQLGVADLGLITMPEMLAAAAAVADVVGVPVIADVDTGFGGPLNVQRTIRSYERAGIAAIHLEDQEFPKRCGQLAGKSLLPIEEATQRIRAAVAARRDPDFLIIARCDALTECGMEEVERRGRAYMAAGADMLFIESPGSIDEIQEIHRRLPFPHLYNMTSSGKSPYISADEATRLGYRLMILPNFTALAAIKAVAEVLAIMQRTGSVADALEHCATFKAFTALGGMSDLLITEKEFSVTAAVG